MKSGIISLGVYKQPSCPAISMIDKLYMHTKLMGLFATHNITPKMTPVFVYCFCINFFSTNESIFAANRICSLTCDVSLNFNMARIGLDCKMHAQVHATEPSAMYWCYDRVSSVTMAVLARCLSCFFPCRIAASSSHKKQDVDHSPVKTGR